MAAMNIGGWGGHHITLCKIGFGLFTVNGEAKYALWDKVDSNTFNGLGRNGVKVNKTFDGNIDDLLKTVKVPYINDLGEN